MPATPILPSLRAYVSLSVLAEEILGLSRARVYELIERGALPMPIYDLRTRRPIFNEDQQRQALTVRQTGVGIDGCPVIFYRRRPTVSVSASPSTRQRRSSSGRYADLVANLRGLGVSEATEQTVSNAIAECFPQGTNGQAESDVLRVLFRHLRRRESA